MSMRKRASFSVLGVVLGTVGYVLSMWPSLLPRSTATQVMASVLVSMTCYAIGAIIQGLVDAVLRRRGSVRSWGGRQVLVILVAAAIIAGFIATFQGKQWQQAQITATGVPISAPDVLVVVVATIVLDLAILWIARGLRAVGRDLASLLGRHTNWTFTIRTLIGGIVVFAGCFAVMATGLGVSMIFFNQLNNSTTGQTQPTSTLRSGGPQSLIPWQSLGTEGRAFVDEGPTAAQIQGVTGRPAMDPIRIYAGLESADGLQAQANLALADLQRVGGLSRKAVIVYTPSTNGLVDPSAASAAEVVAGGDVASISMQYTVMPSFMSMIFSQSQSLDAGTILFNTVRQAIDQLPANSRPKLYVYGESLGAFGSQAPFTGVGIDGFAEQTDGALWAGPPANSQYWQQMSALASGGTAWQPIVDDGSVIRFAASPAGIDEPGQPWGSQRGLYLQHATDPVVWWTFGLIANRPQWLDDPRGPGVPQQMTWLPLITFELVTVDLPMAGSMPPTVGHNYLDLVSPGWVSILQPTGWTPENTTALQAFLHG